MATFALLHDLLCGWHEDLGAPIALKCRNCHVINIVGVALSLKDLSLVAKTRLLFVL